MTAANLATTFAVLSAPASAGWYWFRNERCLFAAVVLITAAYVALMFDK